jgi:hypothetical protein
MGLRRSRDTSEDDYNWEDEIEVDPVLEAARERLEKRRSDTRPMWHSATPRVMVIVGVLGLVSWPILMAYLAFDADFAAIDQSGLFLEEQERITMIIVTWLLMALAVGFLGMWWWTTAASNNIRRLTPVGPWRWSPTIWWVAIPIVLIGCGVLFPGAQFGLHIGAEVCMWLYYFILSMAMRNASKKIGATARAWTVVATYPLGMAALAFLSFALPQLISAGADTIRLVVGCLAALYLLTFIGSLWVGMGSIDRACRRPRPVVDPEKEEALLHNLMMNGTAVSAPQLV